MTKEFFLGLVVMLVGVFLIVFAVGGFVTMTVNYALPIITSGDIELMQGVFIALFICGWVLLIKMICNIPQYFNLGE